MNKDIFILILAMDNELLEKAKSYVTSIEATCFEATTLEEALEIYQNNPINICIIDVDIPGAKALMVQINEDNPHVQMIAMGSMSEDEFAQELEEEMNKLDEQEETPVS